MQRIFQKSSLLLVALACCWFAVTNAAYSCVPFNRSELVSPCSVYDPSAFAYIDLSQTTLEAQLAYMNSYITALTQVVTDENARNWAVAWGCQEARLIQGGTIESMRSCAVDAFGQVVDPPTYVPACLDMCKQYYQYAKPVLDAAGLGALLQPSYCDSYTNDGLIINGEHIPCYNVTPSENQTTTTSTCPSGFHLTKRNICSPTCPAPGYSSDQVFNIGLMQQIVSWISFVSACVLVVTFAILPELRRWPNRIILFLLISTLPLSLAFMLATFVGGNVGDVWCGGTKFFKSIHIGGSTDTDPDIRSIASGGLCVFQSWLIVWSTLAISMWWLILLFNTAVLIHNAKKMVQHARSVKLETLFHILGWGLPTVLVIIPTAASKMNYEATNVFCFIASADGYGWRIGCWFVPIGIILTAGFVNILVIFGLLLSNRRRSHAGRMESVLLGRLVISVAFLLVTIALIFAFLIYSSSQLSNNLFWIYDYMVCRVGGGSDATCTAVLDSETTLITGYRLGFAATFFLCVLGFFLVIFFASAKSFLTIVKGATGSGSSSRSRSAGDTQSNNSSGSRSHRSAAV